MKTVKIQAQKQVTILGIKIPFLWKNIWIDIEDDLDPYDYEGQRRAYEATKLTAPNDKAALLKEK